MCEARTAQSAIELSAPGHQVEPDDEDWKRLAEEWKRQGYEGGPPHCMAEYADAVIDALR